MSCRLLSVGCILLITTVAPFIAHSAGPPGPTDQWQELKVGVLPVRSYLRGSEDLFRERSEVRHWRQHAGVWQRRLEQVFESRDLIKVVNPIAVQALLRRNKGVASGHLIARDSYHNGIERYETLQLNKALVSFKRAQSLYRDAWADIIEPRALADVLMHSGLAHLEKGDVSKAHAAFREMFLIEPERPFQQGYHSLAGEKGLANALTDLRSQRGKALRRYPLKRLNALASSAKIDVWVLALIEGELSNPNLHVVVFDRRTGGISLAEQIPLSDDAKALERVDRAVSRWHTCNIEKKNKKWRAPRKKDHWYVDLGYLHTMFLKRPTNVGLFHSPGASISVTWETASIVHAYARAVQMASLPDTQRNIRDLFVSTRLGLGGGLVGGSQRIRVYLQAGLELAVSSTDFEVESSVDCKFFGYNHPDRCTSKSGPSRIQAPGIWFGIDVSLGLRWIFSKGWYLHLTAGVSSYMLESESIEQLNFPISVGLGVGNRF